MINLTKNKIESFKDKIELINAGYLSDVSYYIQALIDSMSKDKIKLNTDNYYEVK